MEIRGLGSQVLRSGALNVQPPFLHQFLHISQVLRLIQTRNTNSKDTTDHASGYRLEELTWSLSLEETHFKRKRPGETPIDTMLNLP